MPSPAGRTIAFDYFHPLSVPEHNWNGETLAPIEVDGVRVLRFGFIEGDAIVRAETAVFDPQSSGVRFDGNGSRADRLATVLNDVELLAETEATDVVSAAASLLRHDDDVVVVKRGARGAEVHRRNQPIAHIPVYRSAQVFKIGSGDVFSAAFAYYWASAGLEAAEAADRASQAVAHYVATRALPIPATGLVHAGALPPGRSPGRIYLAGPSFTLPQRWLIEELLAALTNMGADVFSPFHEVGLQGGRDAQSVALADIAGLKSSDAVLAILDAGDPGTLYEVGFAHAAGLPVVGLAEAIGVRDLTMTSGGGCDIAADLTTAVYKAIWASMR